MSQPHFPSDPYPEIPPALLNSADLHAYAMLGPLGQRLFEPFDASRLKSASYEIRFVGATCHHWVADNAPRQEKVLGSGDELVIPPNSIVFVWPQERFTVPDYLALRFNLAIRWVHRGLLLGTGPLVDPGFEGHLLIPVHNLTNKDVRIPANEGFIWIEVTKISPHPVDKAIHPYPYVHFDKTKKGLQVGQYFEKANKGAPIQSSVRDIATRATELEQSWKTWSAEQLKQFEKTLSNVKIAAWVGGVVSFVSFTVSIVAVVVSIIQLTEATKQMGEQTKSLMLSTQQVASDVKAENATTLRKLEAEVQEVKDRLPAPTKRGSGSVQPQK